MCGMILVHHSTGATCSFESEALVRFTLEVKPSLFLPCLSSAFFLYNCMSSMAFPKHSGQGV